MTVIETGSVTAKGKGNEGTHLAMTAARGTVTTTGMAGGTATATIGMIATVTIGGTVTAMTAHGNAGMILIVGTTTALVTRSATENGDGSTRAIEISTAVETETVTDEKEGTMSGTGVTGGRQRAQGAE